MREVSVFVSGTTGFVGGATVQTFAKAGFHVRAGVRASSNSARTIPHAHEVIRHDNLEQEANWAQILGGCDIVVHIAAPAHLDLGPEEIPVAQRAIVEGTENLAAGAASAGVKRFVYLSSAHVFGSRSHPGLPFRESDTPRPQNHYAIAKLQAEQSVIRAAARSGMDYVIQRAPMVYGPCAPGNFSRLVRLVHSSWPLPLEGAQALRSFIGIDNLAAALVVAAEHPKVANELFNISDGEDCSTAQLIKIIGQSQTSGARLFWAPRSLLQAGAYLVGRGADFDKIFQPFQIDSSHFKKATSWSPPLSLSEGVRNAVKCCWGATFH